MASIFKDKKPPFGKYYISDPLNNSIITVSDTKVVFESVYKNEYSKIEFLNPPTSVKDRGFDGSYNFEPVTIGSNKLNLSIMYAPSVVGYEQPMVTLKYSNSLTNALVNTFVSAAGVNQNPPPGFIPPTPLPQTSIFKDKKPPFGKYYISDPLNNSIITVSDTKVVFESVYKNEYSKIEFLNPPTSLKDRGLDGYYTFETITIGSNKLILSIRYAPGVIGYEQPIVHLVYINSLTNALVNSFFSAAGVNLNPPPGFISPTPLPQTSIFKDKKPPFGKYYISDPLNNSIITVSDTKVVVESVYKNEYSKIEFLNPPTSLKDRGLDGYYNFEPITIGSNKLSLSISYAPGVIGYEQPSVVLIYTNSLTNALVNSFFSVKGVNLNPPPGFIPPSPQTLPPSPQTLPPSPQTLPPSPQTLPPSTPSTKTPSTPSTKSFFDKYFIYIVVFILLIIMSLVGGYFFMKNRKPTMSK